MALLNKKTEEQKAVEQREKAARERIQQREQAKNAFFGSPAGRARVAYEAGNHVFQYEHDVMSQQAIVVAMVGTNTSQKTTDPSAILNSVCNEGWELLNGSFVFVEQGQQSRDKFMSSGQNIAVKGKVVGYYLFKRCEANKLSVGDPWEGPNSNE